jgi:hypothetical protein
MERSRTSIRSGIRFEKTGALVEYAGTVVDVTERRRAEHDLRQAREALLRLTLLAILRLIIRVPMPSLLRFP